MRRSVTPRSFALLGLCAAAALLSLASCDTSAPGDTESAPADGEGNTAASEDGTGGLRIAPVPPGGELLPPGSERSGGGQRGSDGASAYGCSLSTLRSSEDVAAGKERYRYGGVYLHFSEAILDAAAASLPEERQTAARKVHTFTLASRYASERAPAPPGRPDYGIVRMAHCRLPASAEGAAVGDEISGR